MIINAHTRLSHVLDLDPLVVDYIVSLNPHDFARLHHPLMRRVMAPRITLGRVATMVGVPVDALLARVSELGKVHIDSALVMPPLPQSPPSKPAWTNTPLAADIDLLPLDDALDADPLPPVMRAITALAPGEVLRFRHRWEPQPFYDLWTRLGSLEWFAEQIDPDQWWIWVRRVTDTTAPSSVTG